MSISNYPTGFMNGLTVRGMPINVAHPGKVWWVNSTTTLSPGGVSGSDLNAGTFTQPLATIDGAINKATSGDIIMVMPGYTQTIANGTTIIPDLSGIAIIGLGVGALRPTISFSDTSSNIILSGASCYIRNIVLKATVNAVVAGLTITGANNTIDIETQDTSAAVEFISPIVTTATADNLDITWKHTGFAAGSTMTRGIDLVGCQTARINVDFFGCASTAVVNMRTTACDNIEVFGTFYNESVALTKNVVNSTTATWSVSGYDAKGAKNFYGSDDVAVAYGSTAVSTALGTDGTTVTDSATTVLGAIGANNADNAFASTSIVANADGSVLERQEYIQTDMLSLPRCAVSAAKALTTGTVTMFTISGGPIEVISLIGIVTTVVQAQATSTKIQLTTTSPAATVDVSAAAVDLTGAAAGSSISHINTTAILTVVAAGYVNRGNAFATNETQFLMPAGTVLINNASATNTGAITWYLRYVPLSPNSRVV